MNAPTDAAVASRRVVLVPVDGRGEAPVRRYRLARLRAAPPPVSATASGLAASDFAHLKRMHD